MIDSIPIATLAQKLWDFHHLGDALEKADYIVGLGSYDLRVAERCAELYYENWAPLIIFSGNLGNWTRNMWQKSEAEIFADHAIQQGVPAKNIILEKQATNIGENILLTKKLLEDCRITPKKIIVVTKPNTERRAYATYKKHWSNVTAVFTSPQLTFSNQVTQDISKDFLIHEMVGDIQRLKEYSELGYSIPQEIPPEVWHAYEKLVALGYNKHLIKS